MASYKHFITLIALTLCALTAMAQERDAKDSIRTTSPLEKVVDFAEKVLDVLTYEKESFSLALYPAASYSERTGLALGIMPMFQIRKHNDGRPTTITPSCVISTNKMFEVQCVADVYWGKNSSVTTKLEMFYLPDKYYGIGNQDKNKALAEFDFHRYLLTSDLEIGISDKIWRAGLSLDVSYHDFSSFQGDSLVALPEIQQSERWSNGIGVVLALDSRNDVLNPTKGWYLKIKTMGYLKVLGSNDDFASVTLDGRYYASLTDNIILANQIYWSGIWGEAPFHKLSTCGGTRLGRAIPHPHKYIDNFAWLVQSEVRFPIYWRIGATSFVAAGNVSHELIEKAFDKTHFMVGAGLRFKVFPQQGLNIRLDAGLDSRGEHAFYLNIREAF